LVTLSVTHRNRCGVAKISTRRAFANANRNDRRSIAARNHHRLTNLTSEAVTFKVAP
jgi:hypothetical protein